MSTMTLTFGGYTVTTWGTCSGQDEPPLHLWKAIDGDAVAYFTAPRDAAIWYLAAVGAALLGQPINRNAGDQLSELHGVPPVEAGPPIPAVHQHGLL